MSTKRHTDDPNFKPGESDAGYLYRRIQENGGEWHMMHSDIAGRESPRLQAALTELVSCGCVQKSDLTESYQRPHINPRTQNWDTKWDERSIGTRYCNRLRSMSGLRS